MLICTILGVDTVAPLLIHFDTIKRAYRIGYYKQQLFAETRSLNNDISFESFGAIYSWEVEQTETQNKVL